MTQTMPTFLQTEAEVCHLQAAGPSDAPERQLNQGLDLCFL